MSDCSTSAMQPKAPFSAKDLHDVLLDVSTVHDLYHGDCKGCGECCSRFMPLSTRDIEVAKRYVEAHGIEQKSERGDIDMICPYLTDEHTCAIYEARPDICRAYRCDLHARGEFMPLRLVMCNGPYKDADMREVI